MGPLPIKVGVEQAERNAHAPPANQALYPYERTSVSDIVKAVGVAQGTFYYYFDSKQAILEALAAELSAQKRALYEAIVADETLNAQYCPDNQ